MDEELRVEIMQAACRICEHSHAECEYYKLGDPPPERQRCSRVDSYCSRIEQALRTADNPWHPQSECLKQVTQDDITFIIAAWLKPEHKVAAGWIGQKVYEYIESRLQSKLSPHEEVKP